MTPSALVSELPPIPDDDADFTPDLEEVAVCADNGVECCGSRIEQWDDDGSGNPVFLGSECCNSPRPKYPNEIANDIRALKETPHE